MRALGGTASGDAIAVVRAAVSVIGCRVVPDTRVVAVRIALRQEYLRSDKMRGPWIHSFSCESRWYQLLLAKRR